MVTLVFS
ncbi:hypothetical protein D041_0581A, partial [Vibrio parahaemolyticus EKP-008]